MTLRLCVCVWKGVVSSHLYAAPSAKNSVSVTGAFVGLVVLQMQVIAAERSPRCAKPASAPAGNDWPLL